MKKQFIYAVVDCVAENVVQAFFAVSDAEAKRKVQYSIEKDNIPSSVVDDLKLYRVSKEISFPETFTDALSGDQLEFDFVIPAPALSLNKE